MTEAELLAKSVNGLLKSGCMIRMSRKLQEKFVTPADSGRDGLVVGAVKMLRLHNGTLSIIVGAKYKGIQQDMTLNVDEGWASDITLIEDMGTFVLDDASTFHPDFTG